MVKVGRAERRVKDSSLVLKEGCAGASKGCSDRLLGDGSLELSCALRHIDALGDLQSSAFGGVVLAHLGS